MKPSLFQKVDALLHEKEDRKLMQLLFGQEAHAIADVIDVLHNGKRKTFSLLPPEKQAEVATVLSDYAKQSIFPRLSDHTLARFLHFNEEDDATDILQFLPENRRANILSYMKPGLRQKIERLLTFGSETAGGLMDFNFVTVEPTAMLKDVMVKVQEHTAAHKKSPIVIAQRADGFIEGFVPYRSLLFKAPTSLIGDLLQPIPHIPHTTDREKILEVIAQRRGEVLAVVDVSGGVIGVIHLPDLLKVAEAEATEDVYRFAGVDTEEDALDSIGKKVFRRYNWLIINLATAFLASFVVAQFQSAIARIALLAVYMPMVAGEGGNAATQSLAVVVRALAIGEIGRAQARRVILREALAGMINGIVVGAVAAGFAMLFGAPPLFGLILGISMILNLFIAGLFGALVPFVLKGFRVDPAIASTIFVTTATDIFGFLAFLGLGALFL